jgi:hypothetical protein
MADDAPGFGKAPSFISDVQLTHAVTDDKKAVSLLFDNFTLSLVPGGPPVVMRTFSLVFPLKDAAAGATLTGGLTGGGALNPGTGAMLIFRAGGVSHVFDPLFGPDDIDSFTKPIALAVPPGGDLRMTIILALEGSAKDPKAQAMVNLDAVDLTIGPPQPDIHV